MKNTTTIIIFAVCALLLGGAGAAVYLKLSNATEAPTLSNTVPSTSTPSVAQSPEAKVETVAETVQPAQVAVAPSVPKPIAPKLEYADVIKVVPVTKTSTLYGTVVGTEPITEAITITTPQEVCQDVVVSERLPERDGNAGGTAAGAVVGGLLGNQVGDGNGRKVATVAGAIAGGLIGNKVDRNHQGGRVVQRTERQCQMENVASQSSKVTGYKVTYRNPNGTTASMDMKDKPGSRVAVGKTSQVTGYDVSYRYNGQQKTLRMDKEPSSNQLPVIDGRVVTQTAALNTGN